MKTELFQFPPIHISKSWTIAECIGNTPLLEIKRCNPYPKVRILAKAEWFNPGGSVKDRPALYMIKDGVEKGLLTREKTLLDSTSGNTGIAYALLGAALGYRVELVVPGNISQEKQKILRAFGANLVFSDPLEGSDGAQRVAQQRYEQNREKYFMPDQYNNEANPRAHYETTGPEILEQTEGKVTHFVAGIGTSGTLVGTGRRLKEYNKNIKVIAMEPEEAVHGLEGLKNLSVSNVPGIYDPSVIDETVHVATEDAYAICQRLAREEGLLVGYSSGAAMLAALQIARKLDQGMVVTVFPDGGDRYLSHFTDKPYR